MILKFVLDRESISYRVWPVYNWFLIEHFLSDWFKLKTNWIKLVIIFNLLWRKEYRNYSNLWWPWHYVRAERVPPLLLLVLSIVLISTLSSRTGRILFSFVFVILHWMKWNHETIVAISFRKLENRFHYQRSAKIIKKLKFQKIADPTPYYRHVCRAGQL